jgi:hypothetical protein
MDYVDCWMLRWPGEELVGGGVVDAGSFVTMA